MNPRLPHGLGLNTGVLWHSHHQGLGLILLLSPNYGISQKETCPGLQQGKPLQVYEHSVTGGRASPCPLGSWGKVGMTRWRNCCSLGWGWHESES